MTRCRLQDGVQRVMEAAILQQGDPVEVTNGTPCLTNMVPKTDVHFLYTIDPPLSSPGAVCTSLWQPLLSSDDCSTVGFKVDACIRKFCTRSIDHVIQAMKATERSRLEKFRFRECYVLCWIG